MAYMLERPRQKNELVKRFILMRCRLHGNESDPTIARDFQLAEEEAKSCVDAEMIDVIEEITDKCITSCDLNRYADRKNPCVFAYNLASMPMARSRRLWSQAMEVRDTKLFSLVAPQPEDWKVNFQITVINVDQDKLRKSASTRSEFVLAIQEMVASFAGETVLPEHVTVDIWPGCLLSITVAPSEESSAADVRQALMGVSLASLSEALADAFDTMACHWSLAIGEVQVGEIRAPPILVSDRSDAIWKVCAHAAWFEQNSRDWDGAQGGAITGTALGYKHSMEEDEGIIDRVSKRMGFDGYS